MSDVTHILSAINEGDPSAAEQLLPLVYDELRRLAAQKLAQEKPGQTLQATALVHEAYLRLAGPEGARHWNGRVHFFRAAADAMRRILVDFARSRGYQKRGGGAKQVALSESLEGAESESTDVVALNDALDALADVDERKSQVVELRFFGGLSIEETAEVLNVSRETVKRDWKFAKMWLLRHLRE